MLDQDALTSAMTAGLIYAVVGSMYEQLRDDAFKMRARIGDESRRCRPVSAGHGGL